VRQLARDQSPPPPQPEPQPEEPQPELDPPSDDEESPEHSLESSPADVIALSPPPQPVLPQELTIGAASA